MLKQIVFEEASATADWVYQYRLMQEGHPVWTEDEEIVLGMSPDYAAWDDYGTRSRTFPPISAVYDAAPFYQASSGDGTGTVVLTDPDLIEIRVPWNMMRQMGPGSVHVSLSWRRLMPVVTPLAIDVHPARVAEQLRIMSKRMGVPVSALTIYPGVATGATSRTTLLTGTLPVIDGVV